jgi:hypothetical protein
MKTLQEWVVGYIKALPATDRREWLRSDAEAAYSPPTTPKEARDEYSNNSHRG